MKLSKEIHNAFNSNNPRAVTGETLGDWRYKAEQLEAELEHEKMCMASCEDDNKRLEKERDALVAIILTILDQVDYTSETGPRVNEAVGAVLPLEILKMAREATRKEGGE